MQLSLDLLETFAAVVHHRGDAAEAARELEINQPSMSKRLANLQHANGLLKRPWLRREGKKWHLTREGELVLPIVQDLLGRYRNLRAYTNALPPEPRRVLRFACGQTAGSFLVRRALQGFYQEHPDAQIQVSTMRAPQRIAGLVGGAFDVALVGRDNGEIEDLARGTRLRIETLGRNGYCLACSKQTAWAAKFAKMPRLKALPLSALGEFPLIVPESESHTRQILDPLVSRQAWGSKVEYRIEIGGWLTILDCVRAGMGVGLVSEMAAEPVDKKLLFRRISDPRLGTMPMKFVSRKSDWEDKGTERNALIEGWRESLKLVLGR